MITLIFFRLSWIMIEGIGWLALSFRIMFLFCHPRSIVRILCRIRIRIYSPIASFQAFWRIPCEASHMKPKIGSLNLNTNSIDRSLFYHLSDSFTNFSIILVYLAFWCHLWIFIKKWSFIYFRVCLTFNQQPCN